MLLASDVLECAAPPCAEAVEAEVTPHVVDVALPLKRQRLVDTDGSHCSTQQHWAAPGAEQRACDALPSPPLQPAAAVPWQGSHLLDYVHRCLEALVSMHPVCASIRTHTKAAEMGCAIFRRICQQYSSQEQAALARDLFVAQALLAASLWVAVKWEATRTTTPDSAIMSRITGVPAAFLRHLECKILAALRWNLMDAAREVGAVGCVDLSDGPALDQQAQLEALAQPPMLHWPAALAGLPPMLTPAAHALQPAAAPAAHSELLACITTGAALPSSLLPLCGEHAMEAPPLLGAAAMVMGMHADCAHAGCV
ncbi:hypothetical protein ABPG75_002336 [Micractinium tetrahymenae]